MHVCTLSTVARTSTVACLLLFVPAQEDPLGCEPLNKLAPDALTDLPELEQFTAGLQALSRKKALKIKALLLDQVRRRGPGLELDFRPVLLLMIRAVEQNLSCSSPSTWPCRSCSSRARATGWLMKSSIRWVACCRYGKLRLT